VSYLSASLSRDRKKVLVWERTEHNNRIVKKFDAPYYFFIQDETGIYKDIHGNSLSKIEANNSHDFYELKIKFKNNGYKLYESDIQPHYKILSDNYYNHESGHTNLTFYDIEVDYDKQRGFSSPADPYAPVSAISVLHYFKNEAKVFAVLPSNNKWSFKDIDEEAKKTCEIIICKNERELLLRYIEEISDGDILSGWNSAFFDDVYVYKRIEKLFGNSMSDKLSFNDAAPPAIKEIERFGNVNETIEYFGRQNLDYLELFKKFELKERHSYKLEDVAEDIIPELPKLKYDGSLHDLYYNNFPKFINYNIRDTIILKGLEDKLGYMSTAIDYYKSSCVLLKDVLGTVKIIETAVINEYHYTYNQKVPDVSESSGGSLDKFAGALVLPPQIGQHKNIASIDIESLYPSSMRANNISPETLVGQFSNTHIDYEKVIDESDDILWVIFTDDTEQKMSGKEWKKYIKDHKLIISGYGTLFTMEKQGVIPALLDRWFAERKEFKKLSKEFEQKTLGCREGTPEYNKYKQLRAHNNRMQLIRKNRLVSTYGMLGNAFCRFSDIRLAESTTRTGRQILMHMVKQTALILDGEYAYPSPCAVYSDTDSCYFKTYAEDVKLAYDIAVYVNKHVNKSFKSFCEKNFLTVGKYSDYIRASLDIISDNSIFVGKKYYIMHCLYYDGIKEEKMKVMGLQIKRTNIPKPISSQITKYFEDYLKGDQWDNIAKKIVEYKKLIQESNLLDIGIPRGVNNVEKYAQQIVADSKKMVPNHTRSAIYYNQMLDKHNDTESPRIFSGMKIKTYYLKNAFGKYNAIALPAELNVPPKWFETEFFDNIDKNAQIKRLIDDPIQSILSAIGEQTPTEKILVLKDTLEF
jgi:DNA polymerase elongation subunit (family B)